MESATVSLHLFVCACAVVGVANATESGGMLERDYEEVGGGWEVRVGCGGA